jgi:pimeloyl-ACP methyl ester carboxylesterase
VILLHGFPEDWYAFHRIMPELAKQFRVVAVDLRGQVGFDTDWKRCWAFFASVTLAGPNSGDNRQRSNSRHL